MPTLSAAGRHDLADDEWRVLEPLLPRGRKPGRPPKWSRRRLLDGIRWRVRAGAPWRDVPPQYGPWQSAYGLFRRWQRDGTWKALLAALQALADAAGHVTWDVSVNSAIARAHQHAAGARSDGAAQKEPPGGTGTAEPADHALGRSRGGLTVKFHLACEQGQKPLAVIVTAGQRGDSPQFTVVLDAVAVARPGGRARTRPDRVLADKAYGARANRAYLRRRKIAATIPEQADRVRHRKNKGSKGGRPPAFDKDTYKQRHAVELAFGEVKTSQRGPAAVLRSRSPDLVLQELYGLLLTHYAIRQLMTEAADQAELDPDRLSFTRSLNIVRRQVTAQAGFSPLPPEPGHR